MTIDEISKHNSNSDCWMVIDNKAYDFTNYLNVHPGGAATIEPYCGKDGSAAFATKDKEKPHSQNADNLLNLFYLGDIGQKITDKKIQEIKVQAQNNLNISGGRKNKYEEED